jgi:hypothetical protein
VDSLGSRWKVGKSIEASDGKNFEMTGQNRQRELNYGIFSVLGIIRTNFEVGNPEVESSPDFVERFFRIQRV